MSLNRLSADDIEVVGRCLTAAVNGPFFPEWEFQILMGLTRQEVAVIATGWPTCADEKSRDIAVDNVLNNLLGYPHGENAAWSDYIVSPRAEVAGILARWRGDGGFDASGRGYANRLR